MHLVAEKVVTPQDLLSSIERMPDGPSSVGYAHIPPDLAVEVVSPDDLWHELIAKVDEYLEAGVPLVWVIDPEARSVHIYRRGGTVSLLREGDELSGEEVIPGFRCPMASIFPGKTQPQQPETTV